MPIPTSVIRVVLPPALLCRRLIGAVVRIVFQFLLLPTSAPLALTGRFGTKALMGNMLFCGEGGMTSGAADWTHDASPTKQDMWDKRVTSVARRPATGNARRREFRGASNAEREIPVGQFW